VVQTDAKGETGATMERMIREEGILPERSEWFRSIREEGILPERSEWFRSRGIIGTTQGQVVLIIGGYRHMEMGEKPISLTPFQVEFLRLFLSPIRSCP